MCFLFDPCERSGFQYLFVLLFHFTCLCHFGRNDIFMSRVAALGVSWLSFQINSGADSLSFSLQLQALKFSLSNLSFWFGPMNFCINLDGFPLAFDSMSRKLVSVLVLGRLRHLFSCLLLECDTFLLF